MLVSRGRGEGWRFAIAGMVGWGVGPSLSVDVGGGGSEFIKQIEK